MWTEPSCEDLAPHSAVPAVPVGEQAGGEAAAALSIAAAAARLGVSRWAVMRMIAEGELDAEQVHRQGRMITRVQLPRPSPDDAEGSQPRSRTSRLQEQVDLLSQAVDRLTAMLAESDRQRVQLQDLLHQQVARRAPAHPLTPAPTPPEIEVRAHLQAAHAARQEVDGAAPAARTPSTAAPALSGEARWEREARRAQRGSRPVRRDPEPTVIEVENLPPVGITARPNPMTHPTPKVVMAPSPSRDELLEPVRSLFTRESRRSWWQRLPVVARS